VGCCVQLCGPGTNLSQAQANLWHVLSAPCYMCWFGSAHINLGMFEGQCLQPGSTVQAARCAQTRRCWSCVGVTRALRVLGFQGACECGLPESSIHSLCTRGASTPYAVPCCLLGCRLLLLFLLLQLPVRLKEASCAV
jgi:hypothetical protein